VTLRFPSFSDTVQTISRSHELIATSGILEGCLKASELEF
jgi:hypothetical protein